MNKHIFSVDAGSAYSGAFHSGMIGFGYCCPQSSFPVCISSSEHLTLALIEKMHSNQHKIENIASDLQMSRERLLFILQSQDSVNEINPDTLRRMAAYLELSVEQILLLTGVRDQREKCRNEI